MTYPYRLEPIVDLINDQIIGCELLAGADACPEWDMDQWRQWYAFLEYEIPVILSRIDSLLFFNLDGKQLTDDKILRSVAALGEHSDRIVIEWTEQHIHDVVLTDVIKNIGLLADLGFLLAIDDIGADSGLDGLGRLGSVGANFCKIDGRYFQNVRDRGAEYLRDLTRHLAHSGAKVIVEWVETDTDRRLALSSGAHMGQGYLWPTTYTSPK